MCDRLRISICCVLMIALAGMAPPALASGCQGASAPDPADGSGVGQSNWACDTYCDTWYMLLDYTPCADAVSHIGYFSSNKQDVMDRDPAHCLGDPPWPEVSETAFVVGYDFPGIPEFARAPLILCRTYYWCVDTWDGEQTIPGPTWRFTLIDNKAWGPTPEDGEDFVPTSGTMTWNLGDLDPTGYALTYNVYMGTDEAAVAAVVTGDTATPMYMGMVTTESYEHSGLDPETDYFWRVDTVLGLTRPPFTKTYYSGNIWRFSTGFPFGGILREWWAGIPGDSVSDLTNDPNYPDNPTGREILSAFEGPIDIMDNYGSRLHGWLHIGRTGEYTFYIAADESGELWLSTDSNPANADLIAHVISGVGPRFWDVYPHQASDPILLQEGKKYYISALMKEDEGSDNIAIAWQGPDTGGAREVISGMHLIPYSPVFAKNPDPTDGSGEILLNATLTWTAGIDPSTESPYATQHVYIGSDPVAVANATTASPEYKGYPTDPNEFGPLSLGYCEKVYWRIDGVSAAGTVLYPGSVWRFKATYDPAILLYSPYKLRFQFENSALDSSTYCNDGTEIGGPAYAKGVNGKAIVLDGIDDYVDVEFGIGIDGNEPRTIAGWVKASTTAIPDWTNVFGFTGPGGEGTHFDIEVVGDSDNSTSGYYGLNLNGEAHDMWPVDLEWHLLAATFDGTNVSFYVDGYFDCFGMPVIIPEFVPNVAINTCDNVHVGKRHDNDNYFPGLIDDVRIYEGVFSYRDIVPPPLKATCPYPGDHSTNVERTPTLCWTPGHCAASIDGSIVYYSEDADAATNRTTPSATVSGSSLTLPMTLDLGQTFYWVVDTVNGIDTWPGDLWAFTTVNWLSVDDMESYAGFWMENNIWETWRDGFGNCQPGSGNDTGANLSEDAEIVLGGIQSMQYKYDNDGTVYSPCTLEQEPREHLYSKIEAQIADLASDIGSDWTAAGVRALSLQFYGEPENDINEPLWGQLQDSTKALGQKVFYGNYPGEDINDINEPEWHEWLIDMADFAIDLNDVVSIAIGIGNDDANTPGGSGTLYLDEIRLYTPRCIPQRRTANFAKLDYAPEANPDCKINCKELSIMAQNWLQTPETTNSPANVIDAEDEEPATINFKDYAELINNWLKTQPWPF